MLIHKLSKKALLLLFCRSGVICLELLIKTRTVTQSIFQTQSKQDRFIQKQWITKQRNWSELNQLFKCQNYSFMKTQSDHTADGRVEPFRVELAYCQELASSSYQNICVEFRMRLSNRLASRSRKESRNSVDSLLHFIFF